MRISDWSPDVCSSDLTQRLIVGHWRFWPPRASSLSAGAPNRASTWAMLMPRLGMAALFSCCTRSTSRTSADATPARQSKAAADKEIRMRGMKDSHQSEKLDGRCVLHTYDQRGSEPSG